MTPFEKRYGHLFRKDESGCWVWIGATDLNSQGKSYGLANDGITRLVHRISWVWHTYGDYSELDGYDVHHICENTLCVNPEHLHRVTRVEHKDLTSNDITTINKNKTHCNQGHEFTPENVYLHSGKRMCRECRRQAVREYRARLKAS